VLRKSRPASNWGKAEVDGTVRANQGRIDLAGVVETACKLVGQKQTREVPAVIAVAAVGSVYFTAERANQTDAGTILFRYNPQYSDSLGLPSANGPQEVNVVCPASN
jgi:hypothetical protein